MPNRRTPEPLTKRALVVGAVAAVFALAPAAAAAAAPTVPLGPVAASAQTDAPVRPVPRRRATIAKIVAPVMARRGPSARARAVWKVPTATGWSEQSQTLLVLRSAEDRQGRRWLQLELPIRPNRATAWIPADYAALSTTNMWITVSTARRLVSVYRGGRLVRRFRAVVGRPGTPTPHGLFAL